MDMVQHDCPYIDTTVENDVSFYAKQWDFNPDRETLETRIMVRGEDTGALTNGLETLRDHDRMRGFEMLKRQGKVALLRSRIGQTNAMGVVQEQDGYITGPFEIEAGSEVWHVGFDRDAAADEALTELERENEFTVESRHATDLEDHYDLVTNVDAATALLDGCRDLSTVERDTIAAAVEHGYFTDPRDATLSTLAEEFGVSKMAVSKNLRRGQRKLLEQVVDAMGNIGREQTADDW